MRSTVLLVATLVILPAVSAAQASSPLTANARSSSARHVPPGPHVGNVDQAPDELTLTSNDDRRAEYLPYDFLAATPVVLIHRDPAAGRTAGSGAVAISPRPGISAGPARTAAIDRLQSSLDTRDQRGRNPSTSTALSLPRDDAWTRRVCRVFYPVTTGQPIVPADLPGLHARLPARHRAVVQRGVADVEYVRRRFPCQ